MLPYRQPINDDYLLAFRVTAFEPTALLAERVQNISMYTVYIDMFGTRSAKSAVGSKAVTRIFIEEAMRERKIRQCDGNPRPVCLVY